MEIVKRLAKGHICKPIDTDNSVMMTRGKGTGWEEKVKGKENGGHLL